MSKSAYRQIAQQYNLPVQVQAWWLDAVCGTDGWEAAVVFKNGQPVAALPYSMKKKWGLNIIANPPLSPFSAIWIKYPDNIKLHTKYSWEIEMMDQLISQLPYFHFFNMTFHYNLENWLPFFWRGFGQQTRYSYILPDISKPEKLFGEMKGSARRHILKAQRSLEIVGGHTAAPLLEMVNNTFKRQGLGYEVPEESFQKLETALQNRQQGFCFYARDRKSGKVQGGVYAVTDDDRITVLLTGSDPQGRNSGVVYFLYWHLICHFSSSGKILDFEGSMLPHIETVYRSFGATRIPFIQLYKSGNLFWDILARLTGNFKL